MKKQNILISLSTLDLRLASEQALQENRSRKQYIEMSISKILRGKEIELKDGRVKK